MTYRLLTDSQSVSKTMARSVKKPGERRQEFIRAAETLFMEKGYQNTSVSHIVNRVGVAHGLFYYYFDSKEALLDVIVEDMLHQSEEELQRISRAPGTALEKLHQFMHYMFTMKKDKVYLVGYLQREKNVLLYHRWMKQAVHRLSPLLASIVQQGVEEGTFDAPHPGIAVTFLLTGQAAASERLLADRAHLNSILTAVADIWERVLGAPPGSIATLYHDLGRQSTHLLPAARDKARDEVVS